MNHKLQGLQETLTSASRPKQVTTIYRGSALLPQRLNLAGPLKRIWGWMTPGELALASGNHTPVTQFILLGFSSYPELQQLLFVTFLLIYAMTVMGNLGMMALIFTDSRLHSPMYFFLSVLSFLDICYSSVVTPKLLVNFLASDKTISFEGCVVQLTFFVVHVTAESFLLASMAYDRFVAICQPLHYGSIMTKETCLQLVAASYAFGGANSAIQTGNVFALPFCGPNQVTHYFCDIPPLLRLACANTATAGVVLYIFSALVTLLPAAVILTSYSLVLVAIGRMRSAAGREKALSTCASHFLAIAIFYGTVVFTYVQPHGSTNDTNGQIVSVFYTIIIPMLNPFIYSLRNKEVKDALQRKLQVSIFPC
ncbi:olfactory receptor 1052-like isoform X1 [Canis lupus dingo]|uniref:olfactory receptor 1052-like isoform X1 n=1 Tax=Canis lupus dingo TaxID=286419 RepID=UPI0015F13458|nr:olfactory receptor 1052-like isoform X1 [Canis lupus dingo]